MMVPLIAFSLMVVSTGMSEEGYDSDVYEFNRANDVSNTKRAVYYKPYQKEHERIEIRPEPAQYKYRWKVEDSDSGNFFGHAESR